MPHKKSFTAFEVAEWAQKLLFVLFALDRREKQPTATILVCGSLNDGYTGSRHRQTKAFRR